MNTTQQSGYTTYTIDTLKLTRRDMLSLLALAGSSLLVSCAINPVTGRQELSFMSPEQELSIDKQYAPDQISQDYGRVQDTKLQNYVAGVGKKIGSVSHRPEMPYSVNAVNANYINAYAFPGGTIGVTRGILLKLDNESELAALVGHEVGHVSARHTAARMSQQTLIGLAVAGLSILMATQVDDDKLAWALGLGGTAAAALLLARYSREDEFQADNLGLEYMCKAGYNPNGVLGLMDMLQSLREKEPSMLEQMFSTHPMSTARYNNVRQNTRTQYASYESAPLLRERYMDKTARLRRLKPAIDRQTDGEEALIAKKYTEGESLLKQALKLAPNDYTGLMLMAKAKMAQQDWKGSIPYLDRAMKAYPGEAQAPQYRAVVEKKLNNKNAALEYLHMAEQNAPHNPMIAMRAAILKDMA